MKIEYHNLYTHFILITANRIPLIEEAYRIRIEKYIAGIVANTHARLYAIYANPDHVHFLVSRTPNVSEERLATIVSESSERFINENKLSREKFAWQSSSSAFSVSKADVGKLCKYILNQPTHHKGVSFEKEYRALVKFYQDTLVRE